MDVDVETTVEIDQPVGAVARFASDPDNVPAWYANIESVAWRTDPPLRVGSRIDFVATFLGRRLAYTYEVVEHAPGVRLIMRTSQGPFPMETTYTFEELPGSRTRMTLRNRGRPVGFAGVTAPLLRAAIRRANRKDLMLLKRTLEARASD